MKEVIFNKEHPKGLVREVDDKKHPPHPHEKVVEEKQEPSNDVILTSPNGTRYKLGVTNEGKLKAEKV